MQVDGYLLSKNHPPSRASQVASKKHVIFGKFRLTPSSELIIIPLQSCYLIYATWTMSLQYCYWPGSVLSCSTFLCHLHANSEVLSIVARPAHALLFAERCCFSFSRLVGVFRMVLQKLIQDGHLEVMESLIDMNNTVLKVI